jgi:DnaK suppressor protein
MALDKNLLKDLEASLKEQETKLKAQLSDISTKNTKNPGDYDAAFPDFGDAEDENAAEVAAFTNNLTLERTLEGELKDVKKALANLADGSYGTCKYCHQEIDAKRLAARPTSSSCVECKKKLTLES